MLAANVDVNPIDRWGGTPLNYATNKAIIKNMISAGAIKGFDWPYINTVTPTATMTDDDYRLYYAAFYNDVNTAAGLYKKGWRSTYDIDGRDPLHVAASMGSFEFV